MVHYVHSYTETEDFFSINLFTFTLGIMINVQIQQGNSNFKRKINVQV